MIIDGASIGEKGCCGSPNGPVLTTTLSEGFHQIRAEFGENGGGAFFWLAAAQGNNVPFDPNTFRLVGDVNGGGLEVLAPGIPEPSTLALLGSLSLGLAIRARRRS